MSDKPDEESVLGSLPATRATRLGAEREEKPAAKAKPKAKAAPKARAKPATRAAAAKQKAAAPEPSAKAHKPRPVRAGAPSLAEPAKRARASEPPTSPPSGTELVTTAIKAAGELAQIGFAVGGQVLRRTVDRLRKP